MTRTRTGLTPAWLALPWVAIVLAARQPIRDNSFLWHVEAGLLQTRSGSILRTDPFSAAYVGTPWRTQSWLAELAYAQLERTFADLGWVTAYLVVVGALTFGLVAIAQFLESRSWLAVAVTQLGLVWLASPLFAPRPVFVSFVLLAAVVLVVRVPRLWWLGPVMMLVWAASHGSFALGIGVLVLEATRRRSMRLFRVALVSAGAASLTAHGWHVWALLLDFARSRDSLALITEWAPPDLLSPARIPYVAIMAVLFVGATNGRLLTRDLWVVVPFLVFGLTSSRALYPAAIVLSPYVAQSLGFGVEQHIGERKTPVAALVAVLLIPLVIPVTDAGRLDTARFPVDAATHIDTGPVFHDDVAGGYLIYTGRRQVFIDDRAELYSPNYMRGMISARAGHPSWRETFGAAGIEQALLRADDGLVAVLVDDGWETQYEDEDFVVLHR